MRAWIKKEKNKIISSMLYCNTISVNSLKGNSVN